VPQVGPRWHAERDAFGVQTLALDAATGDLDIESGRVRVVSGTDAVATRLRIRLGMIRGECVLDRRVGIPYMALLGRKGTAGLLAGNLRAAARTSPGIAALDAFALTVDESRRASVTLRATSVDGEPVALDDFSAGVA